MADVIGATALPPSVLLTMGIEKLSPDEISGDIRHIRQYMETDDEASVVSSDIPLSSYPVRPRSRPKAMRLLPLPSAPAPQRSSRMLTGRSSNDDGGQSGTGTFSGGAPSKANTSAGGLRGASYESSAVKESLRLFAYFAQEHPALWKKEAAFCELLQRIDAHQNNNAHEMEKYHKLRKEQENYLKLFQALAIRAARLRGLYQKRIRIVFDFIQRFRQQLETSKFQEGVLAATTSPKSNNPRTGKKDTRKSRGSNQGTKGVDASKPDAMMLTVTVSDGQCINLVVGHFIRTPYSVGQIHSINLETNMVKIALNFGILYASVSQIVGWFAQASRASVDECSMVNMAQHTKQLPFLWNIPEDDEAKIAEIISVRSKKLRSDGVVMNVERASSSSTTREPVSETSSVADFPSEGNIHTSMNKDSLAFVPSGAKTSSITGNQQQHQRSDAMEEDEILHNTSSSSSFSPPLAAPPIPSAASKERNANDASSLLFALLPIDGVFAAVNSLSPVTVLSNYANFIKTQDTDIHQSLSGVFTQPLPPPQTTTTTATTTTNGFHELQSQSVKNSPVKTPLDASLSATSLSSTGNSNNNNNNNMSSSNLEGYVKKLREELQRLKDMESHCMNMTLVHQKNVSFMAAEVSYMRLLSHAYKLHERPSSMPITEGNGHSRKRSNSCVSEGTFHNSQQQQQQQHVEIADTRSKLRRKETESTPEKSSMAVSFTVPSMSLPPAASSRSRNNKNAGLTEIATALPVQLKDEIKRNVESKESPKPKRKR